MTNFALSLYERAHRVPTIFPISDLARHGVKQRFSSSSWRVFASTHQFMFSLFSPIEYLLVCIPSLRRNPFFFRMELYISSSCSSSDHSPHQGVSPTHLNFLTSHDFLIWTDGSVAFSFWKKRLWCPYQLLNLWR